MAHDLFEFEDKWKSERNSRWVNDYCLSVCSCCGCCCCCTLPYQTNEPFYSYLWLTYFYLRSASAQFKFKAILLSFVVVGTYSRNEWMEVRFATLFSTLFISVANLESFSLALFAQEQYNCANAPNGNCVCDLFAARILNDLNVHLAKRLRKKSCRHLNESHLFITIILIVTQSEKTKCVSAH